MHVFTVIAPFYMRTLLIAPVQWRMLFYTVVLNRAFAERETRIPTSRPISDAIIHDDNNTQFASKLTDLCSPVFYPAFKKA